MQEPQRWPRFVERLCQRMGEKPILFSLASLLILVAIVMPSCQSSPSFSTVQPGQVQLPSEPTMRVRIAEKWTDAKLTTAGRFQLTRATGDGRELTSPLTARATSEGIRLSQENTTILDIKPGDSIDLLPIGADRTVINGASYAGTIRILARKPDRGAAASASASFDIIEIIPVETYLAAVLPRELFPDWPLEAYRVQAICARTYALHERERSLVLNEDFDVEANTQDQAYGPALKHTTAMQAVQDTRGVVLTWHGKLLRAYYSSTCGGRPSSAKYVWRTDAGYEFNLADPLQGQPRDFACEPATYYRWKVERDLNQLSAQIKRWGQVNQHAVAKLTILRSVQVEMRNAADRPVRYTLTDENGGKFMMTGEELRLASNVDLPGQPKITGQTRVRSGDVEFKFATGNQSKGVTIMGRGFGHGVGMCQWCTKRFADAGRNWREMLLSYYPGVSIERAY